MLDSERRRIAYPCLLQHVEVAEQGVNHVALHLHPAALVEAHPGFHTDADAAHAMDDNFGRCLPVQWQGGRLNMRALIVWWVRTLHKEAVLRSCIVFATLMHDIPPMPEVWASGETLVTEGVCGTSRLGVEHNSVLEPAATR